MSDVEQPFWDHLDDLAKRLRRIVLSIAVATIGIASVPADLDRLVRLDLSDYRPMISAVMERKDRFADLSLREPSLEEVFFGVH